MIESFHDSLNKELLLHQLIKLSDIQNKRLNISPPEESLQVSFLPLKKGQTFKAHKHIEFMRKMPLAQESWVVIQGKVKVYYYDLQNNEIATRILSKGDASITYRGGHNYLTLEDETVVYEYKTGPYLGQQYDKVFLNN